MLKSISINNFQSHKKTYLELSEGVNAIIGESDSGKTAILRAINWVVNNRPLGDSFRSKFKNEKDNHTMVELMYDKNILTRKKNTKENIYFLKENRNKVQEFKAFDKTLPKTIIESLNFSDVNIQRQMDAPFLLSESSGEIARYFNKIVNLEKIDGALKNADGAIRKIRSDISHEEKEIKELKNKNEATAWAEKASQEWSDLDIEKRTNTIFNSKNQSEALYNTIVIHDQIKKEEIKINLDSAVSEMREINQEFKKYKEDMVTATLLQETMDKWNKIKNDPYFLLNPDSIEKEFKKVQDKKQNLATLLYEKDQIQIAIDLFNGVAKSLSTQTEDLLNLEQKLQEILPDTCPVCGQKMPAEFIG